MNLVYFKIYVQSKQLGVIFSQKERALESLVFHVCVINIQRSKKSCFINTDLAENNENFVFLI